MNQGGSMHITEVLTTAQTLSMFIGLWFVCSGTGILGYVLILYLTSTSPVIDEIEDPGMSTAVAIVLSVVGGAVMSMLAVLSYVAHHH